jgi:hypothetical protein
MDTRMDGYKDLWLDGWIFRLIDRQEEFSLPANSAEETKLCLTTDKKKSQSIVSSSSSSMSSSLSAS